MPSIPYDSLLIFTLAVVGAATFSLSAAFSGRSAFREMSWERAAFSALLASALIMVLSPLGYLIFEPSLFAAPIDEFQATAHRGIVHFIFELLGGVENTEAARFCERGLFVQEELFANQRVLNPDCMMDIVIVHALPPFLLAALGLGFIYGSYPQLNLRSMLLKNWRSKLNLSFPIFSYDYTWDAALTSLKPAALVAIGFSTPPANHEDKEGMVLVGQLASFSIEDEPRGLTLIHPQWMDAGKVPKARADCDFADVFKKFDFNRERLVLTNESDIDFISYPASSLKRHGDSLNHAAQSFFMGMSALGMVFFAWSAYLTAQFLDGFDYQYLSAVYVIMTGLLLFVSAYLAIWAWQVAGRDYSPTCDHPAILSPLPYVVSAGVLIIVAGVAVMLFTRGYREAGIAGWELGVGLYAILAFVFMLTIVQLRVWSPRRQINKAFDDFIDQVKARWPAKPRPPLTGLDALDQAATLRYLQDDLDRPVDRAYRQEVGDQRKCEFDASGLESYLDRNSTKVREQYLRAVVGRELLRCIAVVAGNHSVEHAEPQLLEWFRSRLPR